MASVTDSRLEDHLFGASPEALDLPCIDKHLKELALTLTDWQEIGLFLDLDEGEIEDVESSVKKVRARSLKMLRKWRNKCGENATYRCLIDTLWKLGRADVIDQICQLLKASSTSSIPQVPSRTALSQCGPTSDRKSVLLQYLHLLKTRYRRKMPGCTVQFPPPPTGTYTDLSLVERQGLLQGDSGVREIVRLTVEGRVKDVLQKSSKVELKDLFKLDQEERKVILIEGPPGSGKTTLSWHICQEWESGKLFSEFEVVVYVQLRDPAVQAARSIADVLPRRNERMAKEVLAELEATNGEGVLFVLDGWDELPGDLPWDSPLRQLVEPALVCPLDRSAVIVTSRPEASTKLHDLVTSRVQILGFTPEKVEDFFMESLKGDSEATKVLMERVEENPAIRGSCCIPLNAAILVTIFIAMGHQLPPSLTGVFVSLVAYCILRHCKGRADIEIRHLSSLDRLPLALQTSFDSLCALAFQGILVNQVTFSEEECEIYPEFATLSLLQAVEGFLDMGLTRTYNFLQLSIQELLAARHLSHLPSNAQIEIVRSLLDHERFAGIFRFYAGITRLQTPGIEGIIHEIVQWYKQDRYDGDYLMELLLECLHEVQDPTLYQKVAEEWGGDHLSLTFPSPIACLSAGYLLPRLPHPHIELWYLDDQRISLFTKGLGNSSVDYQLSRSGLSIDLRNLTLLGQESLKAIAQLLSSSFSIRLLALEFRRMPKDPQVVLRRIGEAMASNTSVRSLKLKCLFLEDSDCPSGDAPGPALYGMLERNKTLETLMFRGYDIGSYVSDIANGLVHNTTVKELVLDDCSVTDTGVKSLADMLVNNTTLETLEIVSCRFPINHISADGVGYLAEALKENNTLRVLRVDKSDVCKNPEPLAIALTVNKTLESLDLVEHDYFNRLFSRITRDANVLKKLMSNGVLEKLLTITIEKAVSEFGEEETGCALMTILEEWSGQQDAWRTGKI